MPDDAKTVKRPDPPSSPTFKSAEEAESFLSERIRKTVPRRRTGTFTEANGIACLDLVFKAGKFELLKPVQEAFGLNENILEEKAEEILLQRGSSKSNLSSKIKLAGSLVKAVGSVDLRKKVIPF
jgi:hypothetical protein